MDSFAVIGGEGFLGGNMLDMLASRFPKAAIASIDIVERPSSRKRQFFSADLSDYASLKSALQKAGATTVFHTASPHPEASDALMEKVNVQGTQNVVKACRECKVQRLVYTSSAGVVFHGQDLMNVDERLPPPLEFLDKYNITKYKAEQIVLQANGEDGLLTCAIRPAGIFGPGDRQATPGFLNVLKNKSHKYQLGAGKKLFDWTYVDNVVHAHLLAAEKLDSKIDADTLAGPLPAVAHTYTRRELPTSIHRTADADWSDSSKTEKNAMSEEELQDYDWPLAVMRNRFDQFSNPEKLPESDLKVAGQAFFITNGQPIDFWDFPRALWFEYAGEDGVAFPPTILPAPLAYYFGALSEFFSWMTGRTLTFSRYRVELTTNHKYHSIERARRVLGYEPLVGLEEGIKRTAAWFKENPPASK